MYIYFEEPKHVFSKKQCNYNIHEEHAYPYRSPVATKICLVTKWIMGLESYATPNEGPILSSKPSLYFIIDAFLGIKNYKAYALLKSRSFTYFLDEDFVKI